MAQHVIRHRPNRTAAVVWTSTDLVTTRSFEAFFQQHKELVSEGETSLPREEVSLARERA